MSLDLGIFPLWLRPREIFLPSDMNIPGCPPQHRSIFGSYSSKKRRYTCTSNKLYMLLLKPITRSLIGRAGILHHYFHGGNKTLISVTGYHLLGADQLILCVKKRLFSKLWKINSLLSYFCKK